MTRIAPSLAKELAYTETEAIAGPRRLLLAAMLAAATSFAMTCSAFTGPRSHGAALPVPDEPPVEETFP